MEKDAPPLGGRAGRFVEDTRPGGAQFGKGAVYVGHFQTDMVQPAAALFQEAGDAASGIGRFKQFDLASARAAEREKCYTHPFLWEVEDTRRLNPQHIQIEMERRFQVAHHHRNVVNALHTLGEHGRGVPFQ